MKLPVARRLVRCFQACEDMESDVILDTCSPAGEVATMARSIIKIPIIKIDEPLAWKPSGPLRMNEGR